MTAAVLKKMRDMGLSFDQAIDLMETMEASAPARSSRSERNARYYAKTSEKRLNKTPEQDAPLETKVSPTPPSKTQSPSPPLPPLKGVVSPPEADLAEQIWALQPVIGGKRRCTRPEVAKAVRAVLRRGADPAEVLAACRAFYALPASTEDGGKFAKGAVPLLANDGWRDFLPGTDAKPAAPTFDGPPELRAWIAEHVDEAFAVAYIDPAKWDGERRALIARNSYSAGKINTECEPVLRRARATVTTQQQTREVQAA